MIQGPESSSKVSKTNRTSRSLDEVAIVISKSVGPDHVGVCFGSSRKNAGAVVALHRTWCLRSLWRRRDLPGRSLEATQLDAPSLVPEELDALEPLSRVARPEPLPLPRRLSRGRQFSEAPSEPRAHRLEVGEDDCAPLLILLEKSNEASGRLARQLREVPKAGQAKRELHRRLIQQDP